MEDSRGQIILVAALAIAVTLVALALVVNTVIFTENLATRETVSGQEAVAFQDMVGESGEALLWRANEYNQSTYENLTDTYRRDVGLLGDSENLHAVAGGSLRDIQVVSIHNGTKIQQTNLGALNDTQPNSTWVVAANVTGTRSYVFNVRTATTTGVTINVSNGGSWWQLNVNSSEIWTATDAGTNAPCGPDPPTTIQVTDGTIDGSPCANLTYAEGVDPPYTITVTGGENATGTYHLIVDQRNTTLVSNLPGGEQDNYDGPGDPTLVPAIYNSTVNISVQTSDLTYTSNVTLQPEGRPSE